MDVRDARADKIVQLLPSGNLKLNHWLHVLFLLLLSAVMPLNIFCWAAAEVFTVKSQRRNKEAILLIETCFQLRERVLGRHHIDTETSLDPLNEWRMENIEIGV